MRLPSIAWIGFFVLGTVPGVAVRRKERLRVGILRKPEDSCIAKAGTDARVTVSVNLSILESDPSPAAIVYTDHLTFTLNRGQVIKGLDQGLIGRFPIPSICIQ